MFTRLDRPNVNTAEERKGGSGRRKGSFDKCVTGTKKGSDKKEMMIGGLEEVRLDGTGL